MAVHKLVKKNSLDKITGSLRKVSICPKKSLQPKLFENPGVTVGDECNSLVTEIIFVGMSNLMSIKYLITLLLLDT